MALNPTSRWDAADYANNGRFVADHGAPVLELLAAAPGERILDVGCGDGALTQRIAAAGAEVVGVDASAELVAAAQALGLDARLGDGATMTFDSEFDAVFSNAALHWMLDPRPVADAMVAALRPGGRLAVEFGGFGNIAAIRVALAAVLLRRGIDAADAGQYYPTPAAYREVLQTAGFTDITAQLIPRQTALPGAADGMARWLRTFRGGFLTQVGVPREEQDDVIAQTAAALAPALRDGDQWYADYVRLRVTARRG